MPASLSETFHRLIVAFISRDNSCVMLMVSHLYDSYIYINVCHLPFYAENCLCTLQHISCSKSTCTDSGYVSDVGVRKLGKASVSCTMQRRSGGKIIERCGRNGLEKSGL